MIPSPGKSHKLISSFDCTQGKAAFLPDREEDFQFHLFQYTDETLIPMKDQNEIIFYGSLQNTRGYYYR